ncbi:MAG: DUF721 domain-containing protein [Proteobacteria bacterium]|nr:DUF721 domain-containing protein [Pseudomonadota bacterium]
MKQVAKRGVLVPVAQALRRLVSRRGIEMPLRQHAVAARWAELVGARIAAHCWPLDLRDGALTVAVADSSWLHQLSFLRAELVVRIRAKLPDCEVESMRLVAAAQLRRARPDALSGTLRLPDAEKENVSTAQRQQAEARADAELPALPDGELRRHIVSARAAQLAVDRGQSGPGSARS